MPEEFKYLWGRFIAIANAGEVNLLTIEAFCRLMKIEMLPHEIEMILDFELVRKRVESENIKAARTADKLRSKR